MTRSKTTIDAIARAMQIATACAFIAIWLACALWVFIGLMVAQH